jgi:hypothetical protein
MQPIHLSATVIRLNLSVYNRKTPILPGDTQTPPPMCDLPYSVFSFVSRASILQFLQDLN